jgi:hypothetical protein
MTLYFLLTTVYINVLKSNLPTHFNQQYRPDIIHINRKKKQTYYYFLECSVKSIANAAVLCEKHFANASNILSTTQPLICQQVEYVNPKGLDVKPASKAAPDCKNIKNALLEFCVEMAKKNKVSAINFYHNNNCGSAYLLDWLSSKCKSIEINSYALNLPATTQEIHNLYEDNWSDFANRCCILHRKDSRECSLHLLHAIAQKFSWNSIITCNAKLEPKSNYNFEDTCSELEEKSNDDEENWDALSGNNWKNINDVEENWDAEMETPSISDLTPINVSDLSEMTVKSIITQVPVGFKLSYELKNNVLHIKINKSL